MSLDNGHTCPAARYDCDHTRQIEYLLGSKGRHINRDDGGSEGFRRILSTARAGQIIRRDVRVP